MSKNSKIVSTISMVPAMYIQVAGGLNLAATKKPKVAGSVNLPTTCGMKCSATVRRRITMPFSKLNLSAHDMLPPDAFVHFNGSRWMKQGRLPRLILRASPPDVLVALEPARAERIKRVGCRPVDSRHV